MENNASVQLEPSTVDKAFKTKHINQSYRYSHHQQCKQGSTCYTVLMMTAEPMLSKCPVLRLTVTLFLLHKLFYLHFDPLILYQNKCRILTTSKLTTPSNRLVFIKVRITTKFYGIWCSPFKKTKISLSFFPIALLDF